MSYDLQLADAERELRKLRAEVSRLRSLLERANHALMMSDPDDEDPELKSDIRAALEKGGEP